MGLTITNSDENSWIRIINQLKNQNIINGLRFTVKYTSDYNGFIYLGEFPHEYNSNNYYIEQKISAYINMKDQSSYLLPRLNMDNIYYYYNNNTINIKDRYTIFYMDYGLILGTESYLNQIQNDFFSKYFNNNEICNIYNYSPSGNHFLGIICKAINDFKIKEFPSLYFYNKELNYTFELDYNDLFKKIGDNYFFLIIFDQMIINI